MHTYTYTFIYGYAPIYIPVHEKPYNIVLNRNLPQTVP